LQVENNFEFVEIYRSTDYIIWFRFIKNISRWAISETVQ